VLIEVNGKAAVQKMTVSSSETMTVHRATALKKLKATDGTGQVIPADKLAERLAEEAPVVIHTGPLAAKYKPLFGEKGHPHRVRNGDAEALKYQGYQARRFA